MDTNLNFKQWLDRTVVSLKELEIGDVFFNVMDVYKKKYTVRGAAVFNRRHGYSTRMCFNINDKELQSKSCKIKVIKIGESRFKEQYKLKPINKI